MAAGIALVFAKYIGPRPPDGVPEPPMVRPVDACYCWHAGWQDVAFVARFNLLNGVMALTPSAFVGQPSHDYEYVGEAVIGRRLGEIGVAADAGVRLDAISPRLAVQGRYAYTWVDQVLDIPNDRSHLSAEVLFQATEALSVRASLHRQITHGGLRAGTAGPTLPDSYPWGEIETAEQFREHDRLMRDNYPVSTTTNGSMSKLSTSPLPSMSPSIQSQSGNWASYSSGLLSARANASMGLLTHPARATAGTAGRDGFT